MSIVRQSAQATEAYDSNYYLVVFEMESCPAQLKGVTHIQAGTHSIFLHHVQQHSRIPCFTCFDPSHSSSKCTTEGGKPLIKHHRGFATRLLQPKSVTQLALQHVSVTEIQALIEESA
uniref:Uncharacterized protein n=1 Tax=Globisporangium ultimum (strain ATCC 200006 / CBS 805.95 / DAOM BR144) TaxID=431595 RepID=K3WLV2_GLOUD